MLGYFLLFLVFVAVVGSFELALGLIGGSALAIFAAGLWWRSRKNETANRLLSENFDKQMSQALADYVQKNAIAIGGDGSFSFRVVGEKFRKESFKELAEHLQIEEDETIKLQTQLVCQPNNPHDPKAVAVTLGGFLIGYVPRYSAERLHDFLMLHGGTAGVNSKIAFAVSKDEFEVELDITEPYTKLDIKPFEV